MKTQNFKYSTSQFVHGACQRWHKTASPLQRGLKITNLKKILEVGELSRFFSCVNQLLLGDFFTMESDLETAVEGLYVHCLLFQCFVCVNLQASGHKSNSHILKLFT